MTIVDDEPSSLEITEAHEVKLVLVADILALLRSFNAFSCRWFPRVEQTTAYR